MKRALLGSFCVGAVAAALAIGLQLSGALLRPNTVIAQAIGVTPKETSTFANLLVTAVLSFAVAWTMLEVADLRRRALVFLLVLVELMGAAWVLRLFTVSFAPVPAVIATVIATALALAFSATRSTRQRRATARLFCGRLAPELHDRLAQSGVPNLSEPIRQQASFVFCEIANESDLIDEMTATDCTGLTREFIELAGKHFLSEGGYLHAADGEGIRVLFGFPEKRESHALDASRAALSFRKRFTDLAASKPDSLGKIDLRIGVSSGAIVATRRDGVLGDEIVLAGQPLEIGRRLARANQTFGSHILIDPRTFSVAGKEILARPMEFLRGAEAREQLEVYELLALAEQATPDEIARRDQFWRAVVYFRERRWNDALAEFLRVKNGNGAADLPLQWYLHRLDPLCPKVSGEPVRVTEPMVPLP